MINKSGTNILLTEGHYKHTLGLARHLHNLGFNVWCLGNKYSANRYSRYLKYVPHDYLKYSDDENVTFIRNLVLKESITKFIPVGAGSVAFAVRNFQHLSEFVGLDVPSPKLLRSVFDKIEISRIAAEIGIRIPATYSFEDWALREGVLESNFCLKKKNELGERIPTSYFNSRKEALAFVENLPLVLRKELMVQETIEGSGEGFFAFYQNGEILDGYTHRRVRETPITGGSSTCAESTNSPDTFLLGKKLLDSLDWHGPAMVEFKRDFLTGDLFFIELNPKYWGSLELGFEVGMNFNSAKQVGLGNPMMPAKSISGKKLVKFQWPFDGDFRNLRHHKHTMSILFDFVNPRVKKNIYFSDPLPYIVRLFKSVLRLVARLKLVRIIRIFYRRTLRQGFRIATWRWFEELSGIPLFRGSIEGYIYIGPKLSRLGFLKLRLLKFNASVNLQSEFDDRLSGFSFESHLHLPTDEYEPLSHGDLHSGVTFLRQNVSQKTRVYVHCREGVSRAATLVIGYLLKNGLTFDQALSEIKAVRPFVEPLDVQIDSLRKYMEEDSHDLESGNQGG